MTRTLMNRFVILLVCCAVGLASAAPSWAGEQSQGQPARKAAPATGQRVALSYVTNPAGSDYYTIAIGQARLVSRKTNIDLSVQPVSPVAIPNVVGSKQAMLGISAAPSRER